MKLQNLYIDQTGRSHQFMDAERALIVLADMFALHQEFNADQSTNGLSGRLRHMLDTFFETFQDLGRSNRAIPVKDVLRAIEESDKREERAIIPKDGSHEYTTSVAETLRITIMTARSIDEKPGFKLTDDEKIALSSVSDLFMINLDHPIMKERFNIQDISADMTQNANGHAEDDGLTIPTPGS